MGSRCGWGMQPPTTRPVEQWLDRARIHSVGLLRLGVMCAFSCKASRVFLLPARYAPGHSVLVFPSASFNLDLSLLQTRVRFMESYKDQVSSCSVYTTNSGPSHRPRIRLLPCSLPRTTTSCLDRRHLGLLHGGSDLVHDTRLVPQVIHLGPPSQL